MERCNDALRRSIDRIIGVIAVLLHTALLIRIRMFRVQQAWLRRKYRVHASTVVRGYDAETVQNIRSSAASHATYVQTSGSTRQPKQMAYDAQRLRTTLFVFLSAMLRILASELRNNRTFFVLAPVQSDGSLTTLMLKKRIVPDYLCWLQAPHCVQDEPAIQKAAIKYGDFAVWLWLVTIANPGLIYATNPSTIATFLNSLSLQWTVVSRFTRDYVLANVDDYARLQQIHARIASRGANDRLARIAASGVTLPVHVLFRGWRVFSCWDGGYTGVFMDQIRQHLPEHRCRHVAMYSMSTETVESVPVHMAGAYAYLPLAPGVLYEFIECGGPDLASNVKRPADLQIGRRYTMVVSDAHGLRRYQTEDVFECVGFLKGLPDLRFIRRRNLSYSFTGEKLTADQLQWTYEQAADRFEMIASKSFLTCFPSLPPGTSIPRYRLVIVALGLETFPDPAEITDFVEARLMEINSEYEAKIRSGRLGMMMAEVVGVADFVTNMVKVGGIDRSQFKFLPLYPKLWETFNDPCRQLGR